jgi:hypothetical protein
MGCDYCFGSKNLRYKKYYFFNEKLSKDEYFKKVKECLAGPEKIKKPEQNLKNINLNFHTSLC